MKLMVIGNIGFDLMAPYLHHRKISSVLVNISGGDRHSHLADKTYDIPECADWRPFVELATKERVDAVVSISGPDPVNLRDSHVKEVLERDYAIPMLANPLKSVRIAVDKAKTKSWLKKRGFPVTQGTTAHNRFEARAIVDKFGYPIVLKLIDRSSGGAGMRIIRSFNELTDTKINFPILIEKYVAGPEFSVEVLNYDNQALPLLPVYKGLTDHSGLHPMERVKLAPAPLDPIDNAYLRSLARRIVTELDLQPTADIDIVWGENGPQILEINPRFGGVTALSIAASGIPVYWALVDMVLEHWRPDRYPFRRSYAADMPVDSAISPKMITCLLNTEGVFRVKLQKLKKTAARIALKADDPHQLLEFAKLAAQLCKCNYDCYLELKALISNN